MIDKPFWMWATFLGVVLFLLVLDLGVFHRKQREIGVRESLWMSGFYIAIAFLFGGWVWYTLGAQSAQEYFTGFLIEKSLALDNIFVISLVFTFFAIPLKYQHKVLFWGILGVIILRAVMIGLGAVLVQEYSWILYIFAAFLVITGIKMLFIKDSHSVDFNDNILLKWMRKHLRITNSLRENQFFVREPHPKSGKLVLWCTPLFVALLFIECMDVIFAVDSVPAIFTITTDPYIVYTSNIFAILGLRALYFALAAILDRFTYLKYALALVLIFIGSKVFIADMLGLAKSPATISLAITAGLIAGGVIFSLIKTQKTKGIENGTA